MARFQFKSLDVGVCLDEEGRGRAVSFTTTVPLYAAATGDTLEPSRTTDNRGRAPGWVDPDADPGTYTVDYASSDSPLTFEIGEPALVTRIDTLVANLPSVNVADYGAAGNGTDQTAALNLAIAALPASGGVLLFPKQGGDYRHTGLNFDQKRAVILKGQGGGTTGTAPATVLYYTAGDAGSGISCRSTVGFTIVDMWVSYSNSAFTGRLVDARGGLAAGDTSEFTTIRATIGSGASAPYDAVGIDADQAINCTYLRTNFDRNKYGIRGKATNASYAVRHSFFGCRFANSTVKHVYNVGEAWAFYGPTVQQLAIASGEVAGFIGYDAGMVQHSLGVYGGWAGDVDAASTTAQIEFAGDGLTVSGFRCANGGSAPCIDVKPPTSLLNGAIDAAVTTLTVDDAHTIFGDWGTVLIDSEEINFTGRTATTLTGCTRGANGTTAAVHADNATVSFLGDTHGIDIDAGTYFHSCTYGVIFRRGVRSGSMSVRARGKVKGGFGAITAVALYEQDVTAGPGIDNGYRGALVPSADEGAADANLTPGGGFVANRAFFVRSIPARDMLITSIAFGVVTAATNDDAMDVGIYTTLNNTLTRVGSSGATTGKLNSTGIKTITLGTPITMQAGRTYYVAFSVGAVGGTAATLAGVSMTSNVYVGMLAPRSSIEFYVGGLKDTSHPLPATVSAVTYPMNVLPKMAVREF